MVQWIIMTIYLHRKIWLFVIITFILILTAILGCVSDYDPKHKSYQYVNGKIVYLQ